MAGHGGLGREADRHAAPESSDRGRAEPEPRSLEKTGALCRTVSLPNPIVGGTGASNLSDSKAARYRFIYDGSRMARTETDKEDLMVEATALVARAEFSRDVNTAHETAWNIVTVGFKKNGSCSVYFEQDPFYQFDADGLLRRSFAGGLLFRTQSSTLAQLQRVRTDDRTTLSRTDLAAGELEDFRQRMRVHLEELQKEFANQTLTMLRCVSDDSDMQARTTCFLETILAHEAAFLAPAIRGRE